MSYYAIGAEAPEVWSISRYNELAKKLAKETGSPFVVVALGHNGSNQNALGFATRVEASAYYDQVASTPANTAYVAVFDKSDKDGLPYDEGFFVATSVVEQVHTKQSAAGWIAAGIAGLFGLMAFGKKRSAR